MTGAVIVLVIGSACSLLIVYFWLVWYFSRDRK